MVHGFDTLENRRAHLLVVDDDPTILLFLQHTLSRLYDVTALGNSREALDLLSEQEFDLIVTDIQMPAVSGFDILTAVREDPAIQDTPVILISGMSETNDIVHGLELGANDYVTKPFERKLALARIRTQLALKNLVDAHKETIRELERIQAMRDRFFHMASHDLKNPMNNIRIGQFLLRNMIAPKPETNEVLDNIEHALTNMNDIIHEFLDNAVIQSQELELDVEAVVVEELLWEVAYQFDIYAKKKDMAIVIQDAAGVVQADSRRLAQSMTNLVSNAVKYSPFGAQITLWTEERGGCVRIFVRDEGPGIPVEERGKLFREFGKLSTEPTDGEGRTGLGLWIVKQLAELQAGTVGAEFPPEGGSIFWIELPATAQPALAV